VAALQARGVAVYLISGGFRWAAFSSSAHLALVPLKSSPADGDQYMCRELTLPIARYLGVPDANVFANRLNWQVCHSPLTLPVCKCHVSMQASKAALGTLP
jgi:hypothetical protein